MHGLVMISRIMRKGMKRNKGEKGEEEVLFVNDEDVE